MEIFGIGPFELALIALIAFIVLGPERIPDVMRQLGRAVRQVRNWTQEVTREYGQDIQEVAKPLNEVREELRGVQRDLTKAAREAMNIPPANSGPAQTIRPPATANPNPPAAPPPAPPAPKPGDTPTGNAAQ